MDALPLPYNTRHAHRPDRPELWVFVRSPDDAATEQRLDAVVDTGADITVVPLSVVEKIGKNKFISSSATMRVADGGQRSVKLFDVEVRIGKRKHTLTVVAVEKKEDYILLGRDILNNYLLRLDAPKKEWWIEPSCFEE